MKNKINFSPKALIDLDEIWEYIAVHLENPGAANDTINGILSKIELLEEFPELGASLSRKFEMWYGYRFLVCHNYIAFYRAISDVVYVDRILYKRRDFMRVLFSDEDDE